MGCSPRGRKESVTTERLTLPCLLLLPPYVPCFDSFVCFSLVFPSDLSSFYKFFFQLGHGAFLFFCVIHSP